MKLAIMALAAMLTTCAAHAAPLETYGKVPAMRMPTISPDGSKVAFIQVVNGREAVVIDQLNPAGAIANIPPGFPTYDSLTWVDSNHLIAYGSVTLLVDLEKRKIERLLQKGELRGAVRAPMIRTRGGLTTLYAAGYTQLSQTETVPTLEAVDLATGEQHRLARARPHQSVVWDIDPDGNLISQSTYDEQSHVWTLQLRRGSDWFDAYSVKTLIDPPSVVGLTQDAKGLVLQTITEENGLEFRRVSLDDGKLGDLVPEYVGLNQLIYDPLTHRPIGGAKAGLELTYVFFDPKDQALWDGVIKAFPDEEVELASWTPDRTKVVVRVTGLKHGVSYHVVDTATHKAMGIGAAFDGITPKDISDIEIVTYPAKDGLPIQALLTLPSGREPRNLPLIVLPHNGPAEGDLVGYHAWAQALASRGYAVLQPQYRGSFGLGWKLEAAGFGEWGRKMQTDLSDGVRALAGKGYIDPKRVCIVGDGSYSSYAALAGVMFEQGVYRCAVAVDPWTDIRSLAGGFWADAKKSSKVRNWERLIGAKDQRDPVFDKISPADHAADASAPILIVSYPGPNDDPVKMANALNRAKKPAELVTVKPGKNFNPESMILQTLQATVDFVEKYNPPN